MTLFELISRCCRPLPSLIPSGPEGIFDTTLALVAITLAITLLRSRIGSLPGPRSLPFLGVALQIPSDKQWLKFHEWTLRYGVFFRVLVYDPLFCFCDLSR